MATGHDFTNPCYQCNLCFDDYVNRRGPNCFIMGAHLWHRGPKSFAEYLGRKIYTLTTVSAAAIGDNRNNPTE